MHGISSLKNYSKLLLLILYALQGPSLDVIDRVVASGMLITFIITITAFTYGQC